MAIRLWSPLSCWLWPWGSSQLLEAALCPFPCGSLHHQKSTMNNLFYFESLSNFYSLWLSLLPQHGESSLLSKGSSDSDRSTQTISLSLVNSLIYLITGLVSHHIHRLYSREEGCSYTGQIRWGHFSVGLPHGLRASVVKREVAGNPQEGAQILQLLVFTPLCNLFPSVSWP